MFSHPTATVTIHYEPLIVVFSIIAVIFIFYIIQGLFLNQKCKRIVHAVSLGEYDLIIRDGEKILNIYTRYNQRLSSKNLIDWIEYLHFALAVSYFAKSNAAQFFNHINCLTQNNDSKNFWLSLFHFQHGNIESAQTHYEQISRCEETQNSLTYLDAITLEYQGKLEEANQKFKSVYDKLNHPILKKIAEKNAK